MFSRNMIIQITLFGKSFYTFTTFKFFTVFGRHDFSKNNPVIGKINCQKNNCEINNRYYYYPINVVKIKTILPSN